jgi:hypothetical protein
LLLYHSDDALGKNWQTRAWDPVFKTAGSAPDAAMILGLFSQKNLKINIDRKLYWIVHLYLDFFVWQTLLINLRIVIKNMIVVFIRKNCI